MMSAERAAKLRQWQDRLFESIDRDNGVTLDYLGMKLEVPPQVHPPSPQPELLGVPCSPRCASPIACLTWEREAA